MTAETCPRCGRPIGDDHRFSSDPAQAFAQCQGDGDVWCMGATAAYRRGIDEGVRLAKEHATCTSWTGAIDWSDVDKAAAKAKGEA